MEDPVGNAILAQYFRRLEKALRGLPPDRREQIIDDLRTHVDECLQAETEHSDATVLAILDRVGDPDEIAREALADDAFPATQEWATGMESASASRRSTRDLHQWRLGASVVALLLAVAAVAISVTSGRSRARATRGSDPAARARLVATHSDPGSSAWLPASDVSGDHGSPGASSCSPQTTSGSESASALEAVATKVASGSVDGHRWSLWARHGQSGADAIENGGIIVDGTAHGLCPGFPNPGEMELLEPASGGKGIAYGVVGYPGKAKVAIYRDTFGNFATTKLVASTTAQKINGVGFFITQVSRSACQLAGVEMNTASASYATEHNLAFATNHCKNGQLVPISNSQGIWELPTRGFPDKLQNLGGGGGGGAGGGPGGGAGPSLVHGWLPASDISGGGGIDTSSCGPQTISGFEPLAALERSATKVASGTLDGHSWSVWSKNRQRGATGLEDGGVVVDGVAHGMCPGFPNPSETELLEPNGGGDGIAYGVVGYAGPARVAIYEDTFGNFATTKLIASTTAQRVSGVGFYITRLSVPACKVNGAEINSVSSNYAAEHNLAFTTHDCKPGQLVPISDSQGEWQMPRGDYPDKFQQGGGGSLLGGGGQLSRTGPDFSSCSPRTNEATSGQLASSIAGASQVAAGVIDGQHWSLWSKHGEHGSAALEDAGVILGGRAYGICPGVPNPAEFELIDPSRGRPGIVIGISGYNGPAGIKLSVGRQGSFSAGALLYHGRTVSADGTGFFLAQLPKSACDYSWLELDVTAHRAHSQHLLGFGSCRPGRLSEITGSQGAWSASR